MEAIANFFKLFRIFFPFIRELLFGEHDESEEAVRRNKMVVFLLGCLLMVFVFYYHNAYEFDEVAATNNALDEKAAVLQSKLDASTQTNGILQYDLGLCRARVTCPIKPDIKALNDELLELRAENERISAENSRLKHSQKMGATQ